MAKFFGSWSNVEDVANDFGIDSKELEGINVLVAWYGQGYYEGSAFVLFEKDGKWYEVNGSHCSCYGLEEQWEPEETTAGALLHRLDKGEWTGGYYADEAQVGVVLREMLVK